MSQLSFKHVFAALLVLAAAGALFVPPEATGVGRGHVDGLVSPVARPTRMLAGWISTRVHRGSSQDRAYAADASRTPAGVQAELNALRATVAVLSEEIGRIQEHQRNIENMGPAGEFCHSLDVILADPGQREALSLKQDSAVTVRPGMAVLMPDALIGRVSAAGATACQVRLVTDRESWVKVGFRKLDQLPDGRFAFVQVKTDRGPVLQGAGGNRMLVLNLDMKDVQSARLAEGDWVVLADDGDWPRELQGMPVGRIEKIEPQAKASWFARITVAPRVPLKQLRNVMVMTK